MIYYMKYLNKLSMILAILLLLGIGSCKKFLDQQPITALGPDLVFKDVESARSALVAVYQQLSGDGGYGLRVSLYFGTGDDLTQGPTGAADGSRRDFPLYETKATNNQMAAPYNQLFKGIQNANLCISNIPTIGLYTSGTDQQKKQLQRMLGEALTLRAQFYSEAIRNWGDLPKHFETAEVLAPSDAFPKRTDRDSLYRQLLDDLKMAEDLVPWRNEVTSIGDPVDERITKGAVKALRARIALARGGYSLRQDGTIKRGSDYQTYYKIARDETNDIITSGQHGLNPSFKDLWKNQVGNRVVADPQGELMFQVTAIGKSASADAKIGYNSGPTVVDLATQNGATGTASVFILPTFFYYFDSLDLRRDVSCAIFNDTFATDGVTFYKRGQPATSIFDGKYRRSWLNPPLPPGSYLNNYTGLKWQIIRYSDVLLMFAEAENELNGPTANAYTAINMVRRRGFGKSITTPNVDVDLAGLSKDDFFKAIVRERAYELSGEGIRKFDLIRWNLLNTAITETKANITKLAGTTYTAWTVPSYMAPPSAYLTNPQMYNPQSFPKTLYFKSRTSSDDATWGGGLILNSLYKTTPTPAPSGSYSITWFASTTGATVLAHYATGFLTLRSELLPIPQDAITAYGSFSANMPQNPNY
jgi:hypothetical protein